MNLIQLKAYANIRNFKVETITINGQRLYEVSSRDRLSNFRRKGLLSTINLSTILIDRYHLNCRYHLGQDLSLHTLQQCLSERNLNLFIEEENTDHTPNLIYTAKQGRRVKFVVYSGADLLYLTGHYPRSPVAQALPSDLINSIRLPTEFLTSPCAFDFFSRSEPARRTERPPRNKALEEEFFRRKV